MAALFGEADVVECQGGCEKDADHCQAGENGEQEGFGTAGGVKRKRSDDRGEHDTGDGPDAHVVMTCHEITPFGGRYGAGIACLALAHEWKC